jgi:hypothetical protein
MLINCYVKVKKGSFRKIWFTWDTCSLVLVDLYLDHCEYSV